MTDVQAFHDALRSSHIVAGVIGLIVFWIPVFATKGGRLHRASGKTFTFLAYFVAATAAVSCVWALSDPISFSGITRELTIEEINQLSSNIRFFFSILAVLMSWLVAALQLGIYSMRTKGVHDGTRNRVLFFQIVGGIASVALLLFGLSDWLSEGQSRSFIAIALGAFGALDSRKTVSGFLAPPTSDKAWWYTHMECMIGSGIAFHTAFFVFGFTRLTGLELSGSMAVVPWLVPAAIGVPATFIWIARYRREFETPNGEAVELLSEGSNNHGS